MWVAPCFRFYTHHNMLRKLHPVYFSHSPISGRSSPICVSSFTQPCGISLNGCADSPLTCCWPARLSQPSLMTEVLRQITSHNENIPEGDIPGDLLTQSVGIGSCYPVGTAKVPTSYGGSPPAPSQHCM